ncbi:MAG TPA: ATP-binding protein [Candidatus Dormibacteraeota bacterium]|nr:ATP-binding protein [Candidatus Dormibacteraeota bacterium]
MATLEPNAARKAQMSELGMAVGLRAEEIYAKTIALLYRNHPAASASAAYLDYRWGRSVVGTLMITRWLVAGIASDKDELEYITRSGSAAAREGVPLVETTRGHHYWRRTLIDVTREEARRLQTPADVEQEVIQIIVSNADASLVALANAYDTQLRETNAELSRASQFKSEFLARMSHQLRTPLTGIIGFCEVLLGGLDGDLKPEQTEDVAQIHKSGVVLLELVNDILDLSKIEAGKIEIAIQDVDVQVVVDGVVTAMTHAAEAKALKLTAQVSPAAQFVKADPSRLREILTNLVSNAIKFTETGSISVASERRNGVVEISVTDTGIGIPRDAHQRIFEEFRQANEHISTTYGGTGLGLSIARRLAELQGGHMGVDSTPGRGSRFWFTLPSATAERQGHNGERDAVAAPAAEDPDVRRHRLLEEAASVLAGDPPRRDDAYVRLFAGQPLPMLVYDVDTFQILDVNDAAIKLYGYSHSDFTRLTLLDVRPAEDVHKLRELTRQVPHFDRSGPWQSRRVDGTVLPVMVTSQAVPFGRRKARLVIAEPTD